MADTSMTTATTQSDTEYMTSLEGDVFGGNEAATDGLPAQSTEVTEAQSAAQPTEGAADAGAATETAGHTQAQPEGNVTSAESAETQASPEAQQRAEEDDEDDQRQAKTATQQQGPPQMRFRPANDERTIEAARMMKAGLTYDEVQEVLTRRNGNAAEETQEEGPDIAGMQTRIAELDAVLDKAGEDESVMTKELALAIRERGELAAELKLVQRDVEQRAQQREAERQSAYASSFEASTSAAVELYPDAENPDSELSRRIGEDVQEILNTPGHPLSGNPETPMLLAVKHARALGIAPATGPRPSGRAQTASTTAPNQQTQTQTQARTTTTEASMPRGGLTPATGASRTAPPGPVPTAQQAEAELARQFANAKTDDEAAGLLAVGLFGAATPVNPFA